MRIFKYLCTCLILGGLLSGCSALPAVKSTDANNAPMDVMATSQPLRSATACTGAFVTHTLPFATGTRIRNINTYDSNGAGVAVNDLDGDGDLDLVFASIDREAAILWNDGGLNFRAEPLPAQFTRGVQIVDAEGDGTLDIVFTHRGLEAPSYWRNNGDALQQGAAAFVQSELTGVESYAYSMGWADLAGDTGLDLVTGSYNIDLIPRGIEQPAEDEHAGVFLYTQQEEGFSPQRLTGEAQALSVALTDLNSDGQSDIWVANDFDLEDGIWLQEAGRWQAARPFAETSHSTMSIEWGDVYNDGKLAFFTTDMMPYDDSPETQAAWAPVMEGMMAHHEMVEGDPQVMENVLQVQTDDGEWTNEATGSGVAATGWSWAGKLGDLDNDGLLDLYVVNGMIAENMFGHLPQAELVEQNQVFRNAGDGSFESMPEWELGSTTSGRGMVMADLDMDGDLDILVNNLRHSAQLFENQLCQGAGLAVDLRWTGSANSHAVGSQLQLYTNQGVLRRDVRASGGYLSGEPVRIHFGVPQGARLERLRIVWPDGQALNVTDISPQTLLTVMRATPAE